MHNLHCLAVGLPIQQTLLAVGQCYSSALVNRQLRSTHAKKTKKEAGCISRSFQRLHRACCCPAVRLAWWLLLLLLQGALKTPQRTMQLRSSLSSGRAAARSGSRNVALRVRAVAAPAAAQQQQKMGSGKNITFMKYQGLGNDFILVRQQYFTCTHGPCRASCWDSLEPNSFTHQTAGVALRWRVPLAVQLVTTNSAFLESCCKQS